MAAQGALSAHNLLFSSSRYYPACRQIGYMKSTRKSAAFPLQIRRCAVYSDLSMQQVFAAVDYMEGTGDASACVHSSSTVGVPSVETSESSAESYTEDSSNAAKGSVGVVEAMTGKSVDVNPVIDGGIGGDGDIGGNGGGGGGDGDGDGFQSGGDGKSSRPLTMSQKLTLVYAALVGVGGLVGFLKSGSVKSLFSGGITALTLYNVYMQLPVNPVGASSLGVGISLILLFLMGSRYMRTGKIFPAGVVSFVSLIMAGGYAHGIMRSVNHA